MKLGTKTTLGINISEGLINLARLMKLTTKTAVGIDISNDSINLALLKRDKRGFQLLKAVSCPVPDKAMKNGSIEDASILCKAIKELEIRNKIRASQAAVSLLARPLLVQIIEMPGGPPTSIGQFVQNEMKRCVILSGKKIALDFFGAGSGKKQDNSRLLVVATDGQKVDEIAEACTQVRLNVTAIEPPLLAYARAFYDKKIAGKFDCNVLIAILQGSTLTLCVFRKQNIDFVRMKNIGQEISGVVAGHGHPSPDVVSEKTEPDELCQRLAEEIKRIIQFYDVDVPDTPGEWEITVVADRVLLPEDAEESLKAKVGSADLQVRTLENAYQDTPVGQSPNIADEKPSAVAIGLAMKLLGTDESNLKINLLPPEAAEIESVRKQALITANIIAAVILLMILAAAATAMKTQTVNKSIARKKQTHSLRDAPKLLSKQGLLDGQIKQLSDRPDRIEILSESRDLQWVRILNDIRNATPKTVRITNLSDKGDSGLFLQGLALSYEGVHLFVDMLGKSEHIDSVSLRGTTKDKRGSELIRYTIDCSLTLEKRNIADVDR